MTDAELTALATILLVVVGGAQVGILSGQRQQQRLDWAEMYRRRWTELQGDWATGRLGDWATGRLGDWATGRRLYFLVARHKTIIKSHTM